MKEIFSVNRDVNGSTGTSHEAHEEATDANRLIAFFVRVGVLPVMLVAAIVIFATMSSQFLTVENIVNLLRQSVYLILIALGQMLALVTGGFDLSVGTTVALTSVVSGLVMSSIVAVHPELAGVAIAVGCLAGVAAGVLVGLVNGFGISRFGVSPFIMTMGVQSIGFGIALFMTGGVPVSGMPSGFGEFFGFGSILGFPVPLLITLVIFAVFSFALNRTAVGRYFFAVGGNAKAAALSGIDTKAILLMTYVVCAVLASISGLLTTARISSGEANIGGALALESIAACVIAGVSLRGGIGRAGHVVLGAIFIRLVQNGMNLAEIGSYLQTVVLGVLLIVAVIADQLKHKYVTSAS